MHCHIFTEPMLEGARDKSLPCLPFWRTFSLYTQVTVVVLYPLSVGYILRSHTSEKSEIMDDVDDVDDNG